MSAARRQIRSLYFLMIGALAPVWAADMGSQGSACSCHRMGGLPRNVQEHTLMTYSFTKDAGSRIIDETGSGFHGQLHGPSYTADGYRGQGLRFRCGKDYGEVAGVRLREFTFSAWIKTETGDLDNRIICILKGDQRFCSIQGNSQGGIGVVVPHGREINDYTTPLKCGRWTHIAVTFDGFITNVYQDGALIKTCQLRGYTPITGSLFLGGMPGLKPGRSWHGVMDDIVVLNKVLDSHTICELFAAMYRPPCRRMITIRPCCAKPTGACVTDTRPCRCRAKACAPAPASCSASKPAQACAGDKRRCQRRPVCLPTPVLCHPLKPAEEVAVTGDITGPTIPPRAQSMIVEAWVDDISDLWLKSDGLLWKNVTFSAVPGRGDGRHEPTWIDRTAWYPVWNYAERDRVIDLSDLYPHPLAEGCYRAELLAVGPTRAGKEINKGTLETIPIHGNFVLRLVNKAKSPQWFRVRVTRVGPPRPW